MLFEFEGVCNYFSAWHTPQDFFLSNFASIFSFMSERFNVTNNTSSFVWLPLTQVYCNIEDSRIYLFVCQFLESIKFQKLWKKVYHKYYICFVQGADSNFKTYIKYKETLKYSSVIKMLCFYYFINPSFS